MFLKLILKFRRFSADFPKFNVDRMAILLFRPSIASL